jgi:superfamily II DNA or RNA helicase
MGFCRTNLFKRLESSGQVFQQSIARHILRNYVFLHAIENGLPLPIGTQDSGLLDAGNYDEDVDDANADAELFEQDDGTERKPTQILHLRSERAFKERAAEVYESYASQFKSHFRWLRRELFIPSLADDLRDDAARLMNVLSASGDWQADTDAKLDALVKLLTQKHAHDKVIVFTQYADTVRYLEAQLRARGMQRMAGVTGEDQDPTGLAWRFSPESNGKRDLIAPADELRVLVATDVLSEGQNLQDAHIIVNFDLPWAIIRLIQRAGRVDRIGQQAERILCYSFLPADGVESLIHLRSRVRQHLRDNAEVVGTDEAFFEDERERQKM